MIKLQKMKTNQKMSEIETRRRWYSILVCSRPTQTKDSYVAQPHQTNRRRRNPIPFRGVLVTSQTQLPLPCQASHKKKHVYLLTSFAPGGGRTAKTELFHAHGGEIVENTASREFTGSSVDPPLTMMMMDRTFIFIITLTRVSKLTNFQPHKQAPFHSA